MDLRNTETKEIIKEGIAHIRNPFLKEMIKTQNFSISKAGGLCPFSIAFYIVPLVNSTIRVGTAEEKALVFESMLEYKAFDSILSTKRGHKGEYETKVEQACRVCTSTKRRQTKAVEESYNIVDQIIQNKELYNNKIIAVKLDHNHAIDKNLTGLLATKLMSNYQHPVLILNETHEGSETVWSGSGRSFESEGLNSLKDFLNDSGLSRLAQGHANAFGSAIADSDFTAFIEYANKELEDCDFQPIQEVDFIWGANNFTSKDILDLAGLKTVCGQGIPEPKIALEDIKITPDMIQLMSKDKNPTIKISLNNGVDIIKFKASEEEFETLTKYPNGYIAINILGSCAYNEWMGKISAQILVDEYEVVGESKFYF